MLRFGVLFALHETFGDINKDDIPLLLEEEFQEIEVLATDWEFVRDDSTLNDLQSSVLSDLETSVENSLANSVTNEHNMSEIFSSLASTAEICTTEYASQTK